MIQIIIQNHRCMRNIQNFEMFDLKIKFTQERKTKNEEKDKENKLV